jgi:hypothetical protein
MKTKLLLILWVSVLSASVAESAAPRIMSLSPKPIFYSFETDEREKRSKTGDFGSRVKLNLEM